MGIFSFRRKEKRLLNVQDLPQSTKEESCGAALNNNIFTNFTPAGTNLAPVFAAVSIISNSVGVIPWKALNDDRELLKQTHYLNHLFDNSPVNRFLSVKNVIRDVLMKGNGFLYIDRDYESGKPKSLIYLPVSQVTIYKGSDNLTLYYSSSLIKKNYIPTYDMLHFKINSIDGLIGVGIPVFAHNTFETADYTEKAVSDYMASGGNVRGILTPNNSVTTGVPNQKKQIEEIRRNWDEARGKGTSTVILPADLKFTQLSTNAKDSALIDTRLYNLQDIARYFNISPVLLGDLSHNSYGTLEQSQLEFLQHSLQPFIVMVEEEVNKKLIMPSKRGLEYIDLDENAILATDKDKQSNYVTSLIKNGVMSINEGRKLFGLAPVEGGDKLVIPFTDVNQNTVGVVGEENPKQEAQKDKEEEKEDEDK